MKANQERGRQAIKEFDVAVLMQETEGDVYPDADVDPGDQQAHDQDQE